MLFRTVKAVLVLIAALPASAGGRLLAKNVDAPLWVAIVASLGFPAMAIGIAWGLARKWRVRQRARQ